MKIITTVLLLGTTTLFAQQVDSALVKEIPVIKQDVLKQKQEINTLKIDFEDQSKLVSKLSKKIEKQNGAIQQQKESVISLTEKNSELNLAIDSLSNLVSLNNTNITTNSNQLGTEIQKVTMARNTQISALDDTIGKNRLYWIFGSLGTLLLGALMYLFLGKRIKSSKTDVETQIRNTKQSLEEESIKLDNKLVDILETQLKVKQEESKVQPVTSNKKEDHSLALKVADEVVRMQKNIAKMDSSIKGIKPLTKGIERIQNNFAANGYEMVNHMNKQYDDRMNIDVISFILDENLLEGNRIITRIIKPQVNFNGVLIQRAQVDVSQN